MFAARQASRSGGAVADTLANRGAVAGNCLKANFPLLSGLEIGYKSGCVKFKGNKLKRDDGSHRPPSAIDTLPL